MDRGKRNSFSASGTANRGMEGHPTGEAADVFPVCLQPKTPTLMFAKAVYSM